MTEHDFTAPQYKFPFLSFINNYTNGQYLIKSPESFNKFVED